MKGNFVDIKKLKYLYKQIEYVNYNPNHCQYCGAVDPENGFYPMLVNSTDSTSSLICNDCDKKLKEKDNVNN